MEKNSVSSLLTPLDNLFTTEQEREEAKRETVIDIPLTEIDDFPHHPFKVRVDENMVEMMDSVREHGVLIPAVVRPKADGKYEMVSGHRRKRASEMVGKEKISCIVRDLTDDEAIIIMVDSNLQREKILPSEKAFAYKMKLDAMKRQGIRVDLTSDPVGPKLKSRSNVELASQSPDSKTQIQRYIRLTNLVPTILDMVDDGKIAMRPAVEISYLTEDQQYSLCDTMELEDCTPSHAQTIKMRKFAEEGKLTGEVIQSILQEEKSNQKEQFRMPQERISKYFPPGTSKEKMQDTIVQALEYYRKRQRSMER